MVYRIIIYKNNPNKKRMGTKPVHQADPFIITKNIRGSLPLMRKDSDRVRASIWIHIYSNLKEWQKKGSKVSLTVTMDQQYQLENLKYMKIHRSYHSAEITGVEQSDDCEFILHIKIRRLSFWKKVDYRYGGVLNYLDSRGNF